MKNTIIKTILLFTFAILLYPKPCSSQEVSISIKPAVTEIVSKTGRTIYQNVVFTNSGDPQVYTFRLYQLDVADKLGNFSIKPKTDFSPIKVDITAPYIRLDKPFLMHTNALEQLPIRIDIPDETPEGEYFIALVPETEKPLAVEGGLNVRISPGEASIFFIRIVKDNSDNKIIKTSLFKAISQASFPFFNSHLSLIDSNHPIPFTLILKNKGVHTVQVYGNLVLKNMTNNKTEQYSLLPVYIYPNKDRLVPSATYDIEKCEKQFGDTFCSKEFSFVHPGYSFGLIEAIARIEYGEGGQITYANDFFIVIPFFLLWIMGIGTVLILVLLVYMWKKHLQQATHGKTHSHHIL